MMGASTRILVAALGALVSACILIVPSADAGGPHCKFAGGESTCGRCMAEHCGAAIDACCFGDACGGVVADLETCATTAVAGCATLKDPNDRAGAHRDLSACVAKNCQTVCDPPPPSANVTQCRGAYVTSRESCECEIGSAPNDTACTETGHPALRCCASEGWPGPVRACECLKIICVPIANGCLCQLSPIDDNARATECDGQTCCYNPRSNDCSCSTVACLPQERVVPSCTIAQLACKEGRHHVEACSVPRPP